MPLPQYLSFDHQYVETAAITDATALTNGVANGRFVLRTGAFPAANGYAAGVSTFDQYGQGTLSAAGYTTNPSTTPRQPGTFPYQGLLNVITSGIVIVEVAPSQTITLEAPIFSDTSGRAVTGAAGTGKVVLGRALDAVTTTGTTTYIRIKLGNEAGAALA